ncbi:NADH-quinone oxidoreductase subunit J [Raineyella sp. LH-20]|uniref:NADH-quinone oxidoreductase subunit J n=1 Tax=Raineyella sp. LH-20 TaxID=3081204 RepID=UPI00295547AD|nr:NADH-quinone oxidoreductase subunit J [Raineyella sp. LH-20]WOP19030.1 NADH-quinone oxidoreductase subunit J [Raineyella sp. LH-20]
MIPLVTAQAVAFWLLAPLMVLAALGIVLSRKPVHSALLMAFVMIALAVQYGALDSPFLLAVQIIVYTGAIMMLFLFVVMLVGVDTTDSIVETIKGQRVVAVIAAIALLVLVVVGLSSAVSGTARGLADANSLGNAQGIAGLLFNRYVLVLEAAAALLLIATIGAMVLAHRERTTPKKSQPEQSRERMQAYARTGAHPGGLPSSGVFARHNGVDAPALLPDGSVAEPSVSRTLKLRGVMLQGDNLADPVRESLGEIDPGSEDAVGGRTVAQARADQLAQARADQSEGARAERDQLEAATVADAGSESAEGIEER